MFLPKKSGISEWLCFSTTMSEWRKWRRKIRDGELYFKYLKVTTVKAQSFLKSCFFPVFWGSKAHSFCPTFFSMFSSISATAAGWNLLSIWCQLLSFINLFFTTKCNSVKRNWNRHFCMLLDLKSTYRILSWLCQSFHSLISKTPLLSKHKQ